MAVLENAHALARYAQIAQQAGLVPIVEPEVTLGPGEACGVEARRAAGHGQLGGLAGGLAARAALGRRWRAHALPRPRPAWAPTRPAPAPAHQPPPRTPSGDYGIEETAYVSERVYSHVVRLLNEYNVLLEGILLKPNMVLPGLDAPTADPKEVARYTVRTLKRTIPAAVPGIHFLSGGMSEEESTLNLQALQEECPDAPWALTFSYGRALQSSTLKAWAGEAANVPAAHKILVALAKANSEAQRGQYKGPHPVPGGGRILQALRLGGAGK